VHEVLPVKAGYRLVLVYNLLGRGRGQLPELPNYDDEVATIAELLQQWVEEPRATDEPEVEPEGEKLIYPLEHAYTPAEFGFQTLKGADPAIAQVIVAAAERAGCDVHLSMVSIEESGSAAPTGGFREYRRSRYGDDDDDDDDEGEGEGEIEFEETDEFEVEEMFDRSAVATHWCRRTASRRR
jgi:hypothetical protein